MKSDIEIARLVKLQNIYDIARKAGILKDEVIPCGDFKAKISLRIFDRIKNNKKGKLILVTTINPTASGEGKTTMTIGLAQALSKLGKKTINLPKDKTINLIVSHKYEIPEMESLAQTTGLKIKKSLLNEV